MNMNITTSRVEMNLLSSASECGNNGIDWEDEAVSMRELLRHPLPQVVKVCPESVGDLAGEPDDNEGPQTGLPVLLHSARRCCKVLVENLDWNKTTKTHDTCGQRMVIPVSYKGWFEFIPETEGENIEYYKSISQIGERNPEHFLVCGPVLGYQRLGGRLLRHRVQKGTVLKLLGVFANKSEPSQIRALLKRFECCSRVWNCMTHEDDLHDKTYAHCLDGNCAEILLPFDVSGIFFPVGEPGTKRYDVVYRLCDITRHLELPIDVRLVEGNAPVGSKSFTGRLRILQEFSDETAIAKTLGGSEDIQNMFEISENTPLMFFRSKTFQDIIFTSAYKSALRICDSKADAYASSIKFTNTVKPVTMIDTTICSGTSVPVLDDEAVNTPFANRSLPPLPCSTPEEAFAHEPDYAVIPGAGTPEPEDYLVPAEAKEPSYKTVKMQDGVSSTILYSNVNKENKMTKRKQLMQNSNSSPIVGKLTLDSNASGAEDCEMSVMLSDEEQSMLAQLEKLFDISADSPTEQDSFQQLTERKTCAKDTLPTVTPEENNISEKHVEGRQSNLRHRRVSEEWLRDARDARHKSVTDFRHFDDEVFQSPTTPSTERRRKDNLVLRNILGSCNSDGDEYDRRRLGSIDRMASIKTARKLKMNPNATIRVHNIRRNSQKQRTLTGSHFPPLARLFVQETDDRCGTDMPDKFTRRLTTPISRPKRHESVSSTNSGVLDSGFISPPSPRVESNHSDYTWKVTSDATSSFDQRWMPPYDLSSLTVLEVVKCLRYIGMKQSVMNRFRDEQIDGKLLKELDDNLLREGFPNLNALERKKDSGLYQRMAPTQNLTSIPYCTDKDMFIVKAATKPPSLKNSF